MTFLQDIVLLRNLVKNMFGIHSYVGEKLNRFLELLYIESDENIVEWGVSNQVMFASSSDSIYYLDPYNLEVFQKIQKDLISYRETNNALLLRPIIRNTLVLYMRESLAEKEVVNQGIKNYNEWREFLKNNSLENEVFVLV